MKIESGHITIGDVVDIPFTADETLTGKTLQMKLVTDGIVKYLTSPSISGATATFTTSSATFSQAGDWYIFVYDATGAKHYNRESGHHVVVRPKPEDMAVA